MSATLRNLREKANSMKPRTIFIVFIHEPDFGALFSQLGNMANSVNGKAKATAKPNMPKAGPRIEPDVVEATSKKPMIGPVHEKLTNVNVNAIRKIESSPVVEDAFESTAFPHFSGSLISNHPKKLRAKNTSIKKKNTLKKGFVDHAFRAEAPKSFVTAKPKMRYITTIDIP